MRKHFGISLYALCAVLLCSPAGAASINIGGSGGVLGTGLLSGNSGGTGNTSAGATVNSGSGNGGVLNLGNGNGGLLNLGNDDEPDATANANLGNTGQGNVLLDLFGNGGDDGNAQVTLGMNGLNGGDAGGIGSESGNVRLDLFGNGDSNGNDSGGGIFDEGGGGSVTNVSANGSAVASLDTRATRSGCFSPNSNQLTKLASRHSYGPSVFATWNNASVVKVIDVGLCPSAAHTIATQPNIGRLQHFVGGSSTLRGQLAQWGHKPGDVIAVDRQGKTLIFYVA